MTGNFGFGPLEGASGLLVLLQLVAMSWFAFVTWRAGSGPEPLGFMVAVITYGVLEGAGMLARLSAVFFPYTSGTESVWLILWSGHTVVGILKSVALVVVAVLFLRLALHAKKSRRT